MTRISDEKLFVRTFRTDARLLAYAYRFETAAEVRPHSYNGYLTPFEKRAECTIKQWCYKER